MEILDLLYQEFRMIVRSDSFATDSSLVEALSGWLREKALPELRNLAKRASFRKFASWSIKNLGVHSSSSERKLIERIESDLPPAAALILPILKSDEVRAGVPVNWVGPLPNQMTLPILFRLDEAIYQIELIVNKKWRDPVCKDDFFDPTNWGVACWPEVQLPPLNALLSFPHNLIGDFVGRCALVRLNEKASWIANAIRIVEKIYPPSLNSDVGLVPWQTDRGIANELIFPNRDVKKIPAAHQDNWDAGLKLLEQIRVNFRSLGEKLLSSEFSRLRESCVILTQALTSIDPSADLSWLELSESGYGGVNQLRGIFNSPSREVIESVAVSIQTVFLHYDGQPQLLSAVEEAIATGGLVLVKESHQLYWETRIVPVNSRLSWKLMLRLAEKGLHGMSVEVKDLYDQNGTSGALAMAAARLRAMVPSTLRELIGKGDIKESHKLDLDRTLIHVL